MDHTIINYLNGTASEEEEQRLLNWIHESDDNHTYFLEIKKLWSTCGYTPSHESKSTEAFIKFKTAVLASGKAKTKIKKRIFFTTIKYAAAITTLAIFSLSAYYLGTLKQPVITRETISVVHMNQVMINANKKSFSLPDGTRVWLNRDSKLSYPDTFASESRIVQLEGEAYFEVSHQEDKPFFVETADMQVKVLGTHFDINAYSKKEKTETVLVSGKVEVSVKGHTDPVTLMPDQMIALDKQNNTYHLEKVDASEYIIWKNNKLIMNNETLETIFRKLQRWYGVDISYTRNIPLTSRFSITITDESKEEIFRLLAMITPIKYKIKDDRITVSGI